MVYYVYLLLINIIRVFTLQIYTFLRIVAQILVKNHSNARIFMSKSPQRKGLYTLKLNFIESLLKTSHFRGYKDMIIPPKKLFSNLENVFSYKENIFSHFEKLFSYFENKNL